MILESGIRARSNSRQSPGARQTQNVLSAASEFRNCTKQSRQQLIDDGDGHRRYVTSDGEETVRDHRGRELLTSRASARRTGRPLSRGTRAVRSRAEQRVETVLAQTPEDSFHSDLPVVLAPDPRHQRVPTTTMAHAETMPPEPPPGGRPTHRGRGVAVSGDTPRNSHGTNQLHGNAQRGGLTGLVAASRSAGCTARQAHQLAPFGILYIRLC